MTCVPLSVSLESAEAYFAGRLYTERWQNAAEPERIKALTWGAALMSAGFMWSAAAYDETGWNPAVTAAVCEEALWLLTRDPTEYPALLTKGVRRAGAGPVTAELDPRLVAPMIAPAAAELVGELGVSVSGGGRVVSSML